MSVLIPSPCRPAGARRLLAALGRLTALALLLATPAAATELTLSSWLPEDHPVVTGALLPWTAKVAEATEGRVTVRLLPAPTGSEPRHFEMLLDGGADIAYGLHSFSQGDRFERARIGQFSGIGEDAAAASRAFWEIYTGPLEAEKEHEGVELLGLFVHGPGLLHLRRAPVEAVEDLEGLRIRVPGGYIADLLGEMGVITLFMPTGKVDETMERGVLDGVTLPLEAITAFQLDDDIHYVLTYPGGLYNTTWFLAMNAERWNQLTPEDRAAIEGVSGPAFAELVGKAWNRADAAARTKLLEAGIEIRPLPQEVQEAIAARGARMEEAWIRSLAQGGYDGKAALEELRRRSGTAQ